MPVTLARFCDKAFILENKMLRNLDGLNVSWHRIVCHLLV